MSNRPVKTGQDEFATARLPPGDDEEAIVATGETVQEPHEVLGGTPDAPEATVKGAFREHVKDAHADHGGNGEHSVAELKNARDALLEGSR